MGARGALTLPLTPPSPQRGEGGERNSLSLWERVRVRELPLPLGEGGGEGYSISNRGWLGSLVSTLMFVSAPGPLEIWSSMLMRGSDSVS